MMRVWKGIVMGMLAVFWCVSYIDVVALNDPQTCRIGDLSATEYAEQVLTFVAKLDDTDDNGNELLLFSREDLEAVAVLFKRACCGEGYLSEEICEGWSAGPNYQPQSPYLADHVMFIGMTKLDGDRSRCEAIGTDTCEPADPSLDASPEQWRKTIRDIAESTDGYDSQQIVSLFETYWGDVDGLSGEEGEGTADGTLYKAYYRLCTEVEMIAKAVVESNQALDIREKCTDMIQARYEQERAYVQTVLVEKGVQYLGNFMRGYIEEYFVEQRLSELLLKYGTLDACWRMVMRTVDHTPCCNT